MTSSLTDQVVLSLQAGLPHNPSLKDGRSVRTDVGHLEVDQDTDTVTVTGGASSASMPNDDKSSSKKLQPVTRMPQPPCATPTNNTNSGFVSTKEPPSVMRKLDKPWNAARS